MKELEVIDKLQYLSKYVRDLHVILNDKITKLPDITSLDSRRKARVYNKILDASTYRPETNDYMGRISGHHLDKGNNLARKGLVQYEYIVEHPNKCWDATLRIGTLTKAGNSYFPSHWDEKDCMKAIIEAIQNPYMVEINNGALKIEGICANNIKIKIVLHKNGITTAFPIRGQK